MNKGAWWATVHEVAKSRTWLRNWVHTYTHRHINVLISLTLKNNLSLPHVLFHLAIPYWYQFSSIQFSHSVLSYSLRPREPQHTRPPYPSPTPGSTQTHVHWVGDAIQPSHALSSPSPLALNLSHQGLFKRVSSSHQVAKVLEFQLQHQSFQWTPRTDLL